MMLDLNTTDTLLLLAAGFCALCYLMICGQAGNSWVRSIVKTASVLFLAIIALYSAPFMLLAAALFCCAVGDFFLSRKGDENFMTGVGAFAFGHLAYAALFALHPRSDLSRLEAGWPLVLALGLFGVGMIWVLFRKAGPLRWAVVAYVPVILTMGVAAILLPMKGWLTLVLPAALLFIFSDFVIAQEKFVLPEGHALRRVTPYLIWSTYWAAQLLFLLAFLA